MAVGVLLAAMAGLAAFIGLIRLARSVTLSKLLFDLVQEPLYCSFSLTNFLVNGDFGTLRWPIFLLHDFVNVVPRFIFPMKDSMNLNAADFGFPIFVPLGGVSSFVSFLINFGALGTMPFLFLFSFGLAFLKSKKNSVLARPIYAMITGWLIFDFFRNGFSVSIVKDIFQFSIATPVFVLASIYLISYPMRGMRGLLARRRGAQTSGTTRAAISSYEGERGPFPETPARPQG